MSDDPIAKLQKQMAALAEFGGHSLRTHDLDRLLHEACDLVSQAMGINLVKVLELLPGGDTMLVRAGVNWQPGVVGHATFAAHSGSPSGYALSENAPIISGEVADEDRFEIPSLMTDHGVQSMVNVVIRGESGPWGVLEADAREPHAFDQHDISFLQNYANLIASAIERLEREAELRQAVDRNGILLGELNHRVRNMISNIRMLARRTVKTSIDLDAFTKTFDARLAALGRTQELLALGTKRAVSLREMLQQELRAHGIEHDRRVSVAGPDVDVSPKVAQALGMAFHELATNAGKYGAIGRDDARLAVTWQVVPGEAGDEMVIRWRETGVPIETPPERRGFGSETIEQSLPYMLGGTAELVYHPDGLECCIRFSLTEHDDPPDHGWRH